MSESITAYPLAWPQQQPRHTVNSRERAKFGKKRSQGHGTERLSLYQARRRLEQEIRSFSHGYPYWRINPETVVLSSDVVLRLDGAPHSGRGEPDDPGVAVYFNLDDNDYCLPCDKWDRVADNIAAIAAHLGAMRGMERWGVGSVETHFAGFKSLPGTGDSIADAWRAVLGLDAGATLADAQAAYRRLAQSNHPDKGGSDAEFARIGAAWEQAKAVLA